MESLNSRQTLRKNLSGGKGGGGYDYQAEVTAYIVTHILARKALAWTLQTEPDIPVRVEIETGSGGDDARVHLQNGASIEVQAKRGARNDLRLWQALRDLLLACELDSSLFAVLITDHSASYSVRVQLASEIRRFANGRTDHRNPLGQRLLEEARQLNIGDLSSVCTRLRLIVCDLRPDGDGRKLALNDLRELLANASEAESAWDALSAAAIDNIDEPGALDAAIVITQFARHGIQLAAGTSKPVDFREDYARGLIELTKTYRIAGLDIALSIESVSARFRALQTFEVPNKNLSEEIEAYHEWYRHGQTDAKDILAVKDIVNRDRLIVLVGGPGAGKSTLARKICHAAVIERKLVARLPLRRIAHRMLSSGITFDEAATSFIAEDGNIRLAEAQQIFRSAQLFVADGLDETDSLRETLAELLHRLYGNSECKQLIVTTRPVGHQPSWLPEADHYELLPLGDAQVEECASRIICKLPKMVEYKQFLATLHNSKTATIAARNPLLLGFLIALFANGFAFDGPRSTLFEKIVHLMFRRIRSGSALPSNYNYAKAVLNAAAWLMEESPVRDVDKISSQVAAAMGAECSHEVLDTIEIILAAWEEQGILERLSAGGRQSYAFIHMLIQDYCAACHVGDQTANDVLRWIALNRSKPSRAEVLALLGGTAAGQIAVDFLVIEASRCPAHENVAMVAARSFVEMQNPDDGLCLRIGKSLTNQLSCGVPLIVKESATALISMARIYPDAIGNLVSLGQLSSDPIGRKAALAVALECGSKYVNIEALAVEFPYAEETSLEGNDYGVMLLHDELAKVIVHKGAEFLVRNNKSEVVIERVKNKDLPFNSSEALLRILRDNNIGEAAQLSLDHWRGMTDHLSFWRDAELDTIKAIESATQSGISHTSSKQPGYRNLEALLTALKFWKHGYYRWAQPPASPPVREVFLGAIESIKSSPSTVHTECRRALEQYEKTSALPDLKTRRIKPQWAVGFRTCDPDLLIAATKHECLSIVGTAVRLLANAPINRRRKLALRLLREGGADAVELVARNAKILFGKQHLSSLAISFCEGVRPRFGVVLEMMEKSGLNENDLRKFTGVALSSPVPDAVRSALGVVTQRNWNSQYLEQIKKVFTFWIASEFPHNGVFVQDLNPSKELLEFLDAAGSLARTDDVIRAVIGSEKELYPVADKMLLAQATDRLWVKEFLQQIAAGLMPPRLLPKLSEFHPESCKLEHQTIFDLYSSPIEKVRMAVVSLCVDEWVSNTEAHKILELALEDLNPKIRDEATENLRILGARSAPRHGPAIFVPQPS